VVAVSRRLGAGLALGALLLSALVAGVPSAHARTAASKTYGPPYTEGPSGGDNWNFIQADAASGRVTVFRFYPQPGSIGCGGAGGFASLQVAHRVQGSIGKVTIEYADSGWDAYSFASVLVRTASGRWLGAKKVRGPALDAGTIEVPIVGGRPRSGTRITIRFGLELASACPSVGGGSIEFTSVTVHPRGRG
jgi:hypothetical protein